MSAGFAESDNRIPAPGDSPEADAALPSRPAARGEGVSLPDLIKSVVEATHEAHAEPSRRAKSGFPLEEFLAQPSSKKALLQWFGDRGIPRSRHEIAQQLDRDIARLDEAISRQVNAILHHPRFQKLEASWRGLRYLVDQLEEDQSVKIRMLSVSWKELARDFERAIEFDQSHLFRKVYTAEFGMPGGEPFGVLLGDYEIRPRPFADHPVDDLKVLEGISGVAAAAFAPFVAGAHPAMFGLSDFAGLQQRIDLPRLFDQVEYLKWRGFRKKPDSRFVGLTLPHVLMRLPYEDDGARVDGCCFREDTAGPNHSKYLWGNATYAFGAVLMRSYARSGWFAGIRGVRRDVIGGGLAAGLPVHWFSTDGDGIAAKCSTDVIITDDREPELSDMGFIPLCHCTDTEFSAFYATQSVQEPIQYDDPRKTMNARIEAMLQYTLCVSRFAHHVKGMVRDRIGTFTDAGECQDYLRDWFIQYVTPDPDPDPEVKAAKPLREAEVEVRPVPGEAGHYACTVRLWPHFELDELASSLELTTRVKGPS